MFKLASFTSKGHSPAEKFLFKQCLMEEIKMLNEGFAISLNNKSYFIQCRVIQFVFDTKEVEHQLNVQCINAHAGCPYCYGTYGVTVDGMTRQMAISDERSRLSLFHALRIHGQTATCCPLHFQTPKPKKEGKKKKLEEEKKKKLEEEKPLFYYTNKVKGGNNNDYNSNDCKTEDNYSDDKKEKLRQKRKPLPATDRELLESKPRVAQDMNIELVPLYFEVCDKANAKIIKEFLFYDTINKPAEWYHDTNHYPPVMFTWSKYLYYPTCNYKPFQPYTRKDKAFHVERANSINEKRNRNMAKKYTEHEEGVKDHFYGFADPYVEFEYHLNFDPAHAIANCFQDIKELWNGTIPEINEGLLNHCFKYKTWPFINLYSQYDNKDNDVYPWNISKRNQNKIDSWIISIIIPPGFKNHFEVKSLFVHTQMTKFNIKMNIIKSIFPLVMFLVHDDMPVEYKGVFMMFSEFIVNIMSPVIDSSTIDSLLFQSAEFVSLFQGYFPPSLHHMIWHFLIHMAPHIPIAGIIKNWSSYAGERGNNYVKSFIKKGGAQFEKTSSRSYYRHESSVFDIEESAYKMNSNGKLNRKSIIGSVLLENKDLYIDSNNDFFHNPFRMLISLSDQRINYIGDHMNHFEGTCFLNCLIKEIMKQCKNRDEAHERSELFRLYSMHIDFCNDFGKSWYKRKNKDNSIINKRTETVEIMFFDFLMILYSIQQQEKIPQQNIMTIDEQLDNARDEIVRLINEEINNNSNNNKEVKGNQIYYYQILSSNTSLLEKLFQHCRYGRSASLKALVYGLRCKGRGYEKRRILDDVSAYEEYKLNFQKTWNTNKNEYSSWCKFRFNNRFNMSTCKNLHNENDYFIGNPPKSEYGQMNFFMKLKLPTEKILDGVKIASMTAVTHLQNSLWDFVDNADPRNHQHYKSKTMIDCIDVERMTLVSNSLFIPFTDIYATKYGVIGVDQGNKPFFNKSNASYINNKNESQFRQCLSSDENSENVSKLYFIPLHPERINVCYNVNNNEMYNN